MTGCPSFETGDKAANFGHFLTAPAAPATTPWRVDRHVGGGKLPDENPGRTLALLRALARARNGFDDASSTPNTSVPAGYTYLLQLMAHDMVDTDTPLWNLAAGGVPANARTRRLMLDTLYGGGLLGAPLMFEGARFKMGDAVGAGLVGRERDIVRIKVGGERCPVVADENNDSHAIIGQLTVLFMLLHNAVADRLARDIGQAYTQSDAALFEASRKIVTLGFRQVIRNELLPLILACDVWKQYAGAAPCVVDEFFSTNADAPLPLEFSHGAFRFGHAMINDGYFFNHLRRLPFAGRPPLADILNQSSSRNPARGHLQMQWLVSWSNFFPGCGVAPSGFNHSRIISPGIQGALGADRLFEPKMGGGDHSLGLRDLSSAAAAGLWSVDALLAAIRARPCGLSLVPLTAETRSASCRAAMAGWLAGRMSAGDAAAILADPPLPYFVAHEAWHQQRGLRLGTLGSVLVADVIYSVLGQGDLAVRQGADLAGLIQGAGGISAATAVALAAELASMGRIIQFVGASPALARAEPAFV